MSKRQKDMYVVGYLGPGGSKVWGRSLHDENGVRMSGGGQTIQTLTYDEAKQEITYLISKSPKAIYKLVVVKRFRK